MKLTIGKKRPDGTPVELAFEAEGGSLRDEDVIAALSKLPQINWNILGEGGVVSETMQLQRGGSTLDGPRTGVFFIDRSWVETP